MLFEGLVWHLVIIVEPGFGNAFSLGLHLPLLVVVATVLAAVVAVGVK